MEKTSPKGSWLKNCIWTLKQSRGCYFSIINQDDPKLYNDVLGSFEYFADVILSEMESEIEKILGGQIWIWNFKILKILWKKRFCGLFQILLLRARRTIDKSYILNESRDWLVLKWFCNGPKRNWICYIKSYNAYECRDDFKFVWTWSHARSFTFLVMEVLKIFLSLLKELQISFTGRWQSVFVGLAHSKDFVDKSDGFIVVFMRKIDLKNL